VAAPFCGWEAVPKVSIHKNRRDAQQVGSKVIPADLVFASSSAVVGLLGSSERADFWTLGANSGQTATSSDNVQPSALVAQMDRASPS
jgi:hypothetical protein